MELLGELAQQGFPVDAKKIVGQIELIHDSEQTRQRARFVFCIPTALQCSPLRVEIKRVNRLHETTRLSVKNESVILA